MSEPLLVPGQMACGNCRFWIADGDVVGHCRRYPQSVAKLVTDWCGEFAKAGPAPAADASTEEPKLILESDDEYRVRLLANISDKSLNWARAGSATGTALDEIGSWYAVARKSAPAPSS